jgi:hypothetical protein
MTSRLHAIVFELVDQTNAEQWRQYANTAGLSFSWIRAFAENRIPNPSASRLEKLYEAIKGKPVDIQ